jgi:hypothetical protein
MINWQDQLAQVVRGATSRNTSFADWLKATGYRDMPPTLTTPVQVQSIMLTLYRRYLREQGTSS